jgi:hypothetical protein
MQAAHLCRLAGADETPDPAVDRRGTPPGRPRPHVAQRQPGSSHLPAPPASMRRKAHMINQLVHQRIGSEGDVRVARRCRSQDGAPPESCLGVSASRGSDLGYRPVRLAHVSTSRRSHRSIPRSRLIGAGKSRSRTFH